MRVKILGPFAKNEDAQRALQSWLDDHSRYLLACSVFERVNGDDVVATFTSAPTPIFSASASRASLRASASTNIRANFRR